MLAEKTKEGAPLLAIFEKWGAGPLAAEWLVEELLRCSRGDGAHLAEVMRTIQAFAAAKAPLLEKREKWGTPLSALRDISEPQMRATRPSE